MDIDYDTNNRTCCTSVRFGWKEQANGDRVFAPVKAVSIWYFVIAAAVIYLIWIIVAHLIVSDVETLITNYLIGFCVAAWIIITGFISRMSFTDNPVFTLCSDKSLVLHRLDKTVLPDENTYYELNQKPGDSPVDLCLFHQGKSYYLFCDGEGDVYQVGKELTELLPCDEKTKGYRLAKLTEFEEGNKRLIAWIFILLGGCFAGFFVLLLFLWAFNEEPDSIGAACFLFLVGVAMMLGGIYQIVGGKGKQ